MEKTMSLVVFERKHLVFNQATEVFESANDAMAWMFRPTRALAGKSPEMLCETDVGVCQVLRLLNAIEWGGAC
ncbi:MbcA/ParS/Xre antitoxin family protein [Pseudomonas sp. LJDD11]|uniref:MbcA/ParS/Xre antitoxin family protein n=1 Tax=Pseudomonas sp. LJDD11 TaxID=2931984 RepID=UPI00211CEEC0|nr:MbcA/ParS/Xre antitoxin family protein [Pseudomonas sp. LJDD11]MCQ9426047.1 MbcA/ParS/Xre antitoxin family protein [Pseudomonas sp. LJDD11]